MTDVVNLDNAGGKFVALKLDGKDTTSSVNGPLLHYYNLVLNKKPGPADLRFMQFVKSPEGQKIIRQEKAHPFSTSTFNTPPRCAASGQELPHPALRPLTGAAPSFR